MRTQARGLLVHHGHLALIRVRRRQLERWVLPGGGQDAGEPLQHTVARECREELGLNVEVGPLCLVREFVPAHHDPTRSPFDVQCIDFVFRCSLAASSAFDPTQPIAAPAPDSEALEARWVTLNDASGLPLYPECLRTWLPKVLADDRVHYVGDAL